jgi:DNA-binding transcriptional ArsR family regulator
MNQGSAAAERRLAVINAVFNALAHPARRQILLTIHYWGGEMTAGDIAARFAHAWPTTTRHLRVLTDAGLLTEQRASRNRVYRIVRQRLSIVTHWMSPILTAEESVDDGQELSRAQPARTRRRAAQDGARAS